MARVVRRDGVVSYDGDSIANLSEWSLDTNYDLEELKALNSAHQGRVLKNMGWKASVKAEAPNSYRTESTSLAVGSWTGIDVSEWTFSVEAKVEECTAAYDTWKEYQLSLIDASFDATKWQDSAGFDVFKALVTAGAGVTFSVGASLTPLLSASGYCDSFGTSASDSPSTEKITVKLSSGSISGSDATVAIIEAMAADLLSDGLATPLTLITPSGSGLAYITKYEVKASAGKLEYSYEFQGTGALT